MHIAEAVWSMTNHSDEDNRQQTNWPGYKLIL